MISGKFLLGPLLAVVAALPALADESVITGSVVYRERMLLPADAEATVRLEDVSRADAPAPVLAEVTVPARTSPTPFALPYPAATLDPRRSYGLRATISAGGELMFATTGHVAFDGTRLDNIDLLVQRTGGAAAAASAIVGSWLAEDIGGAGVLGDVRATLSIAADGAVSGRSGCNGFGGTATVAAGQVSFGPLAGTLMACADAVMDQERRFYDALERTASFAIDPAGRLVLSDAAGTALARFAPD